MSISARQAQHEHVLAVSRDFINQPRLSKYPARTCGSVCDEITGQEGWLTTFLGLRKFSSILDFVEDSVGVSCWQWMQTLDRHLVQPLSMSNHSHTSCNCPFSLFFLKSSPKSCHVTAKHLTRIPSRSLAHNNTGRSDFSSLSVSPSPLAQHRRQSAERWDRGEKCTIIIILSFLIIVFVQSLPNSFSSSLQDRVRCERSPGHPG